MKKRICALAVSVALLSVPAAQAQSYRLGDSADEIAVIQTALTELDLYYTDITGRFGQRTERAVRLFQKKVGLLQTGVADERTLELLYLRTSVDAPAVVQGGGTSASSGKISAGQTLREGSNGEAVRTLQERLKALGCYSGTVTGHYGNLTKEAVRRYQRANGLTADGIAGPRTLASLSDAGTGGASSAAGGTGTSQSSAGGSAELLTLNSTGEAVRTLQLNLRTLEYYDGTVTGSYGRLTKEAVRLFQRDHDLTADGVAGPRTLAAIQGALAGEEGRTPAPTVTDTPAPGTTPAPQTGTSLPLSSVEKLNTEVFLRRTSRSGHVTRLQKALKALGFFTESATGYFGSATEEAVIAYQKARGLTVDGVAGRATLRAINEDIAKGGVSASID